MAFELITNYVARARARVLAQYKDLTARFVATLELLTEQSQDLENVFWELGQQLLLTEAGGVWLDRLGAIVGENREGANDADYLTFIRARVLVNISQGRVEDVLGVINAIIPGGWDIHLTEHYPAAFEVEINPAPPAFLEIDDARRTRLINMLRKTRSAGIGQQVITAGSELGDVFAFSSLEAELDGPNSKGFEDLSAPGNGGHFRDVEKA